MRRPPAPIIQAFRIIVTGHAVRVSATGPPFTGRGTAVRLRATRSITVLPRRPGGRCRTDGARSVRRLTRDAGATQVFGVG